MMSYNTDNSVSPATTPGSIDEEKFLVPSNYQISTKTKIDWYKKEHIPFAIITVSLLEIISFLFCDNKLYRLLRFEPIKLHEIWRFFTYMLLHDDWLHLILNLIMQILFAWFLEYRHGHLRVLILYLTGGITGVLGAACVHPDLVIGASGGVYALLISHIADILMHFETMKYKTYRCICIVIIVISDIIFNCVHIFSKDELLISWGAHIFGGMSGLFLGLVLFKHEINDNIDNNKRLVGGLRKLILFLIGLMFYIILMISLVILTFQIKKCTPINLIRQRYIYFC